MNTTIIDSPVGPLQLSVSDTGTLTRLNFAEGEADTAPSPACAAWAAELSEYFAGERAAFTLPVAPVGTPFQMRVWRELQNIPWGQTVSYGELARRIGNANACRAVGLANGRNPVAIVIPCHRVVGADGALTGYAFGLDRKRTLLALEGIAGK